MPVPWATWLVNDYQGLLGANLQWNCVSDPLNTKKKQEISDSSILSKLTRSLKVFFLLREATKNKYNMKDTN